MPRSAALLLPDIDFCVTPFSMCHERRPRRLLLAVADVLRPKTSPKVFLLPSRSDCAASMASTTAPLAADAHAIHDRSCWSVHPSRQLPRSGQPARHAAPCWSCTCRRASSDRRKACHRPCYAGTTSAHQGLWIAATICSCCRYLHIG